LTRVRVAHPGCIYAPHKPYFALTPELVPQQVSWAALTLVNSFGTLGGSVGPLWWTGSTAPSGPPCAFAFMAVALPGTALLMLAVPDTRVQRRPKGSVGDLTLPSIVSPLVDVGRRIRAGCALTGVSNVGNALWDLSTAVAVCATE
jgi:hypothetical protein